MLKMLKSSKISMNKIIKIQSKNITGFFFTVQPDLQSIKKGNEVQVYEAPEWQAMKKVLNEKKYYDIIPKNDNDVDQLKNIWEDCVFSTDFRPKYFGLLPFFLEDRYTSVARKKFVLEMSIYPETKQLKFVIAMISGVHTVYEPLQDIVPIPAEDFRIRHINSRSRPPHFIDMDMIYANRKLLTMYCFDQKGTWIKEGVDNPALKLENSYKENNWFDHYLWDNKWL